LFHFIGTDSPKKEAILAKVLLNRENLIIARKTIVDNFLAEIREDLNDFKNQRIDKKTLQQHVEVCFKVYCICEREDLTSLKDLLGICDKASL